MFINHIIRYPFLFVWRALAALSLCRFEQRLHRGAAANRRALLKILKAAEHTRVGRRFNFSRMLQADDPVAAFQAQVPLRNYADHADDIRAVADGARDVLFPGVPAMFAATSGTSSDPKLLPTTTSQQLHTVEHIALLAPALRWRAAPELQLGQRSINLMLASRPGNRLPGGYALGMSSGGGIRRVLRAAPFIWTSPAAVFELADHRTALYLHGLFGLLDENAGCIEAVFGPHILSWVDLLVEKRHELAADIAAGRICDDLPITPELRRQLERQLQPRPGRAAAIERELAQGDAGMLRRLWPSLQVLSTVVSGPFAVSLPELQRLAGADVLICGSCFGATEGMAGVNLWPALHERYAVSAGAGFFEFLPLAAADEPAPATVDFAGVAPGERYELVLTTFAGLYRYRLGDVVRVVGHVGPTPVFEFDHRRGDVLDMVGEKTTGQHTQAALLQTAEALLGSATTVRAYTVTGNSTVTPYRYRVYLELADRGSAGANRIAPSAPEQQAQIATRLATEFDRRLRIINPSYETIGRRTGRLGEPEVALVKTGTFTQLEEQLYQEGQGSSRNQIKVPRLLRNPAHVALLESNQLTGPGCNPPESPETGN